MIPVSKPCITETDVEAVSIALRSGEISGDTPTVREFETSFANFVGRRTGISVSNGSVALDLALAALNLQPNDEVILPSFTIASCLFAVLRSGATPVFCDVDPITWNVRLADLADLVTERTRAIIAVHTYGLAADIAPISEFCKQRSIYLIEDAAEAHGVRYKSSYCGSFGDISTFSFYANKVITCGEGGMILVDDEVLAARLRSIKNLSFRPDPSERFIHDEIGWNARMSAIQAALGNSQLQRLKLFATEKRRIGLRYLRNFDGFDDIQMQPERTDYSQNIYWVAGVMLGDRHSSAAITGQLRLAGIDTRPFFYPLHLQPLLKKFNLSFQPSLKASENLRSQGFYLPSYVGITNTEIDFISSRLIDAVSEPAPSN
jgi:perosamine synthetase